MELASDPSQNLTTEQILKTIGSAHGTKLLATLISAELDYINNKVKQTS